MYCIYLIATWTNVANNLNSNLTFSLGGGCVGMVVIVVVGGGGAGHCQPFRYFPLIYYQYIDGLVKHCNKSSEFAVELLQSCTGLSIQFSVAINE